MNIFTGIQNIFILVEPCDLRKGIDGYASMVRSEFHLNLMDQGNLYLFCYMHYNKLKCLYYDGTGFWLLYKRLENGTFKWTKSKDDKPIEISEQQLKWLLEGIKIEQKQHSECLDDFLNIYIIEIKRLNQSTQKAYKYVFKLLFDFLYKEKKVKSNKVTFEILYYSL